METKRQKILKFLMLLFAGEWFMGAHASLTNNEFETSEIEWEVCQDKFLCGSWKVPIDHDDLNSNIMELSLMKLPARIEPAEKTVILHSEYGKYSLEWMDKTSSKILDEKIDFISINSRVDNPTTRCKPDHDLIEELNEILVRNTFKTRMVLSKSQIRYYDLLMKRFASSCYEGSGEYLNYISTANLAKDLELLRKKLKLDNVNFWAFGRASILAFTYANMFPEHTGNIIIENVPDINLYFGHRLM